MEITTLSLIYFFTLSITLFDLDFRKAKKRKGKSGNKTKSFKWVGLIYLICIASWISILFINWKLALLGIVIYYISIIAPFPQFIGKNIVNLFKN